MLLYDVTYPHSRGLDSAVSYGYLQRVAKDRRNEGAIAVCINGEATVMRLSNGEWMDQPAIVEASHVK